MTTDPQLPPAVSKTAPDTQSSTVEPLELVDHASVYGDYLAAHVDGNRVVIVETVHDGREPVAVRLERDQVLQLLSWFGHALNLEPCHLPHCQHATGRPYTDEELARGPSARRDAFLERALTTDADHA